MESEHRNSSTVGLNNFLVVVPVLLWLNGDLEVTATREKALTRQGQQTWSREQVEGAGWPGRTEGVWDWSSDGLAS